MGMLSKLATKVGLGSKANMGEAMPETTHMLKDVRS